MTAERLQSHSDWQGRLFHLWRSLLCHIHLNLRRCSGTHSKTQMWCVCCRQQRQCHYMIMWLLADGWNGENGSSPPRCPFNLNQWIPSYRLCSHRAWRLEGKTAVVHSLVASSFVSFYFFDLPVFNPVESHCLYVHLSYPPSLFPQFFYVCLLFCSIISQAPSKGKSA